MAGLFGAGPFGGSGLLGTGVSQNALLHAGLGLLGSANTSNPWAGLGRGLAQGSQLDLQRDDLRMRQERFDLETAERERQQRLDEEFDAYLSGGGAAGGPLPPSVGPGGVDPSYRPPGMVGGLPTGAATPGINPDAPGPGGAAPGGVLERLRNAPGGLLALRGLGRQGASKFLLDQLTAGADERRIIEGADGFNYYADTGERVLPGVTKPDGGIYEGTSLDAQNLNILHGGDPSSAVYAAAYNNMAEPKVSFNPTTGETTTITPNMSAFRPPTYRRSGAEPRAAAPTAAPTGAGQAPTRTGGVTTTGRTRFTEQQNTSAGYANRMSEAGMIMDQLEGQGVSGIPEAGEIAVGIFGETAQNIARSPERQQYRQAQEDWVRAKLRKESGAVIAEEEMEREIQTYFPQIGDSEEVIAQKKRARDTATNNLVKQSGGAYEEFFGQPEGLPGTTEELQQLSNEEVLRRLGIQ